ncbi:hypothetical protein K458DRAFT_479029 [Lentithecium fluviatile CBS 122367]|uniref:Integral membrane protein n=1 Tax=Lentithecium fluviatile CBS 122367 TaxID=1168545 RepID=A0A6G1IVQ2_9PLEO|nr:hypothetical protein K458DRAFT_479029 [Lentithecium fluviatile CBS 122367]
MNEEFRPDVDFRPWGPFVPHDFKNQTITGVDIVIASVIFGLTLVNVAIAIYLGYRQTRSSRTPLRSVYVWLIWLELFVSFCMGLETFLHLLKVIKASFAFYFSILFWWCIQVQLLLQIIINRIRIIVPDRQHSKLIMIWTAVIVTAINISVFNIWIPARLQVSRGYILLNEVWDRIEKGIYLVIDAMLNWYFLKVVKANLIDNGLQKYNKLLRFNQRIIILSLLMDVMIIAAMSIPNSFVYVQFHPLAYLVKLNIEMTMANLIKRIAVSSSRKTGNVALVQEFASSDLSTTGNKSSSHHHVRRSSLIELRSHISATKAYPERQGRAVSFAPNEIRVTEDFHVVSEPLPDYERDGAYSRSDLEIATERDIKAADGTVVKSRSLDDITEGESMKSAGQGNGDSDDEAALVVRKNNGWGKLRG